MLEIRAVKVNLYVKWKNLAKITVTITIPLRKTGMNQNTGQETLTLNCVSLVPEKTFTRGPRTEGFHHFLPRRSFSFPWFALVENRAG